MNPSFAEVTLVASSKDRDAFPAPLTFKVGGSIRPEFYWDNSHTEDEYLHKVHDGGSRLHFHADYALNDQTSLLGYYEWGFNFGRLLKWTNYYEKYGKPTEKRQLYAGISDKDYGQLTYGRHKSIYLLAVGDRTDVWTNDANSSPAVNGVDVHQLGLNRPSRSFQYANTFGPVKLYLQYLLPENRTDTGRGDDIHYRHKRGYAAALNWDVTSKLAWGVAYNHVKGYLASPAEGRKRYNQDTVGTSISWQPGNWYLAAGAHYYRNQAPINNPDAKYTVDHFFARNGRGFEGFAGYTFKPGLSWLQGIQPYVALDHTRFKGNDNFRRNNVYVGGNVTFNDHVVVYLERTVSHSTRDEPNSWWLNFYFDF